MLSTPLLLLGAVLAPHSAVEKVPGPPAICHPIDIGSAKSLPWNTTDSFGVVQDYDLARLVPDAVAILDASGDPLVHMETIRRAVIYTENGKGSDRITQQLLAELRRRIVDTELAAMGRKDASGALLGLCWFDLGYMQGAFLQMGLLEKTDPAPALEMAATLRPADASRELGTALALWGPGEAGKGKIHLDHLQKAVQIAAAGDVNFRRNAVGTAGQLLGADTYDELVAKLDSELRHS